MLEKIIDTRLEIHNVLSPLYSRGSKHYILNIILESKTMNSLKTTNGLKTLIESFDDELGFPEKTYDATCQLIQDTLGENCVKCFSQFIDAADGRFYSKISGEELYNKVIFLDRIVTIEVHRGCVTDVQGLPEGYIYEVNDKDVVY
jgi:hypothetical protein